MSTGSAKSNASGGASSSAASASSPPVATPSRIRSQLNSLQLSPLVTLTFLLPTRIPIQRPLSLPHVPLPLLRHRQPRRLGRAEPLAPGVRRVKGLAELLDLDRLEVGEGRGEGGPEEGVEGEGEGGAFEADVLVGVGEDLGQDGQDGLERDGFGAVGSGEGGWEGRVSVRMGSSS